LGFYVHGAWQGSWVWEVVTPCLSTAGHSCHAVDLPGSAPDIDDRATVTFTDQVEFLKRLLSEIGEPAIVIAHSGGSGSRKADATRDVAPRITAGQFGTVPRIYIEALRDRSVLPVVQRRMQALVPGATIRSIEAGHAPMFADSESLSALLISSIDDLAISSG